nr:hypothetical protein GCM10020092_014790 [Actinoplanes digitatis]
MTTVDIHALVGAYALDAVDDLERVSFERHVADCEACRTEVDELRGTASRLADSTWSVPPPRLRAEVLAAVGRTRQLPPLESARPRPDARAAVSRWRRYTAGAVAAGILAAGAGVAAWAVQEQRVQEQSAVVAEARKREARTEAIMAAPDLVVRTAPMIGGGRVTVASSEQQAASVVSLRADDAPPARPGLPDVDDPRHRPGGQCGRAARRAGLDRAGGRRRARQRRLRGLGGARRRLAVPRPRSSPRSR